jgi:phage terminase large subunit
MVRVKMLPAYAEMLTTPFKYIRLQGSAGSGKSEACTRYVIVRTLSHANHKSLVLRKVARTLRNSVFETFKETLTNLGIISHFHVTTSPMMMVNKYNGSQILFMGSDDSEKLKSIRGISCVFIEEITEFTKIDFNQIRLRVRTPDDAPFADKILMAYNPISKRSFVYKDLHAGGMLEGQELFLKTTFKDNPYLPQVYIDELADLASSSDPAYAKIYAEGEFADLIAGLIYKNYVVESAFKSFGAPVYGLDFGFSNDETALVKAGIVPVAGRAPDKLFIDEEFYEKHLTTSDIINRLTDYEIPKNARIWADSARPEIIEEIKREGWAGIRGVKKGGGSLNSGIMMLQGYDLRPTENSVNVQREFELYKWKEDKDGEPLAVPVDKFNHACDAIRYAIMGMRSKAQNRPHSQTIPQAGKGSTPAGSANRAGAQSVNRSRIEEVDRRIEELKKKLQDEIW